MTVTDSPNTRRLARQLVDVTRRLKHLETVPQLAHSSLDNHGMPVYDADGNLTVTLGRQPDGTYGAKPVAGPIPPAPAGVAAEADAGVIRASWQGVFWAGAALPMDFEAVEVLINGTPRGAIHDPTGGAITVPLPDGECTVSFRTLAQTGRFSDETDAATLNVGPLASEQIEQAKADIAAERAAREVALEDARDALADLDERLNASPTTGELEAIRADLTTAQEIADGAARVAGEANTAASAASQAALEAAGIAASKGRVIVQATEPQGADRTASNIWIKPIPDDPETEVQEKAITYVYLADSDEWQPTTSSELAQAAQNALDAREAAQQAQQRADTAVSNAATAQATAEAAQRTADDATLDARDAHNAAVEAQARLDAKIAAGESLLINGGFEAGDINWPRGGSHGSRSRIIEHPDARTGKALLELTPSGANAYPESDVMPAEGHQVFYVRAWVKRVSGEGVGVRLLSRNINADGSSGVIRYADSNREWKDNDLPLGEWTLLDGDITPVAGARGIRFAIWTRNNADTVIFADDFEVFDVTEVRAAQAAADAAMAEAASKPSVDEVEAAIKVSANGKNAITVSSVAPVGKGVVVGDTWWRVDSAGDIFGQWTWTGSAWSARTVRSEVIASLDVGKLTVTGESRFTAAVVDRLYADIFTAHKITAEQITIAALDGDGNLAPGSVGAITLRDGIVGADKIIADEVAAEVSHLVEARVEKLKVTEGAEINAAVITKLASEMITSGVLRTAVSGQRVVIDSDGIVMYGVDADGVEFELVHIGPSGDNLITAGDTTISPAGVQAPSGTFDELAVAGEDLGEILARLPRGVRAWGQITQASDGSSAWARRAELQTTVEPGRLYRLTVSDRFYRNEGSADVRMVDEIVTSFDGENIHRDKVGTGTVRRRAFGRHNVKGDSAYTVPPLVSYLDTGEQAEAERVLWAMLYMNAEHPGSERISLRAANDYPLTMTLEDVGPSVGQTIKRWNDNTVAAPADPDPVVKRHVKTYTSTSFHTYDANTNETNDPDVVQGLYAGGPSRRNRRGGWKFDSMTGDLSGAKVEKVEAYIYLNHSYYTAGATVNVATHSGNISNSLTDFTQIRNWKRNTGKWITLPSRLYAGFKSGAYQGVGVVSTNSFAEQYARFNGAGAKIRVTYTK